jgi:membrane fusion protein, multidrug efflux system
MRATTALLLLGLAAPVLTGACSTGAAEKTPPQASVPCGPAGRGAGGGAVPITVAPVVEKAMPLDVQAIGSGEAFSNVAVHAQLTGELTSVAFKEGDDVSAGQVLFTLDRRPLEAALQQTEANLQRDQAQAANAVAQAQRYKDLVDRGIATHEQLDAQNTSAASLAATVAADRAAVENARVQLQYTTIAAAIPGRTGALMVHPGNLVRANDATPLVVINQIAPIYVTFTIAESQLPAIERYLADGSIRVRVKPPTDAAESTGGRITFVDNAVDQTTGTIKLKASFDNADHRLWPGQFLNVTMTLKVDDHAIVVPTPAVQTGPQGTYVFVVKADQTVELRPIVVNRSAGAETIIQSGLAAGETVVTDGHLRLVPGSKISIKPGARSTS